MKKNGGVAFPCQELVSNLGNEELNYGMSLRDYFAGQVIVGLMQYMKTVDDEILAVKAFKIADDMLTARD